MTSGLSRTDSELAFAVLVMTVLTLLAYRIGSRYEVKSQRCEHAILMGMIGLGFWLGWSYFGRLVWAETIQSSSVLCWSNMTPIALGFAGGLVGHTRGLRRGFRPIAVAVFMALAIGFVATPIARPLFFPLDLPVRSQWKNNVCMQSHESSCAPAAAATLFRHYDIASSETLLAQVCLSSRLGTAPLGLYRGLKSIAGEHGYIAKVAERDPSKWIAEGRLPLVAVVQFPIGGGSAVKNRFLGNRFAGHAVTVMGRTDGGRWLIGDPAVGKISWSDAELRSRFTGEAIFLSKLR